MKRINYKSDFNFILRLLDCRGVEVGFPDYDWVARFWTGVKANAYEVSCIGGVCKNCYNDDGTIHVVVDNHHLSPGVLRVEFVAMLPDGIYPDGDERVAVPAPLDVELVRTAAPCPSSFEVEVILPYIKFRYEDLTDGQKAELMQPAVDAANHAEAVLKDAEAATAEAVRSNRELAANVKAAAEAETQRQRAEETRVSNEESRQRAETLREDAEAKRKSAETTRVDTEAVRVTSENARVAAEADRAKAETTRVTAENARVSAESKRVEQEDSRKEAEESRASEETKRVDAEAKRVTAENSRKTAEQGRVTAENGRVSAEEARVSAEQERAAEFESWQTELDGKADKGAVFDVVATNGTDAGYECTVTPDASNIQVGDILRINFPDRDEMEVVVQERYYNRGIGRFSCVTTTPDQPVFIILQTSYASGDVSIWNIAVEDQLSNILGNDTEGRIEDIEPGIVAEALRKVPQILTPEEQAVVKNNIGVSKMELFIDLWNSACGKYGKYNESTGYFELNGLIDITYEQAVEIYAKWNKTAFLKSAYVSLNIRTNIPSAYFDEFDMTAAFSFCSNIETIRLGGDASLYRGNFNSTFRRANKLRSVLGVMHCPKFEDLTFESCGALEEIRISCANGYNIPTINLRWSPKISLYSLNYYVTHKYQASATVITVHPDIFSKLTDEANEEWHQLLLDAAEKQITFATV